MRLRLRHEDRILALARSARMVQAGSIHAYLAYIFVTLIVLLLFGVGLLVVARSSLARPAANGEVGPPSPVLKRRELYEACRADVRNRGDPLRGEQIRMWNLQRKPGRAFPIHAQAVHRRHQGQDPARQAVCDNDAIAR